MKRDLHPAIAQVLGHITDAPFAALAEHIVQHTTGPEVTVALRKLLESQDAYRRCEKTPG